MVNADSLVRLFRDRFPRENPTVIARAPGRVNLIGEHVDYHGGWVMPLAIEQATWIAAGPRGDGRLVIYSEHAGEQCEIDLPITGRADGWRGFAQGICALLQEAGVGLPGANIVVGGDLPVGAGLASSAALSVGLVLCLLELSGSKLSRQKIAELCRDAEHRVQGVPCGLMDQLACLFAEREQVMLIDCQDSTISQIAWPREDAIVVIVDSRSPHKLSQGDYSRRVKESQTALEACAGITRFRELTVADLPRLEASLGPMLLRRARHIVTELERVRSAADALRQGNMQRLGELMNESHRSLAQDYEVSSPRMDELADIVRRTPGVFGARMTGAGFGGCVVAIARSDALTRIESAVRGHYDAKYGVVAPVWASSPTAGAEVMEL